MINTNVQSVIQRFQEISSDEDIRLLTNTVYTEFAERTKEEQRELGEELQKFSILDHPRVHAFGLRLIGKVHARQSDIKNALRNLFLASDTYFLHDGRARNLMEAIMWHGGEAQSSKEYVNALSQQDRNALIKFLESL